MKEKILDLIKQRGDGVSFVEFQRYLEGTKGERALFLTDNPMLVIWMGLSEEFCQAFLDLVNEGAIKVAPTNVIVYLVDGGALALPLARRKYHYKTPHWVPTAVSLKR